MTKPPSTPTYTLEDTARMSDDALLRAVLAKAASSDELAVRRWAIMDLSEREGRFVRYWLESRDATEAARRLDHIKNPEEAGRRYLSLPWVATAITEALEPARAAADLTTESLLHQCAKIADNPKSSAREQLSAIRLAAQLKGLMHTAPGRKGPGGSLISSPTAAPGQSPYFGLLETLRGYAGTFSPQEREAWVRQLMADRETIDQCVGLLRGGA